MSELTEFVLARIAEEEADLRDARIDDMPEWWAPKAWSRERREAELAAMQKIVDRYEQAWTFRPGHATDLASAGAGMALLGALKDIASIWSDHPDFREEWR